ncbi:MAG TPA: hypothetical protein VHL10_08170 [Nitrososphaera sp.]|jgi:hypothetical protein|nr:hypothetical protein [Nitrososphaera sp.]
MELAEANAELKKRLKKLSYTDFEMKPGQEDVLMLHVQGHLICSVAYALSMSDEQLKALVDETVQVAGEGEQV